MGEEGEEVYVAQEDVPGVISQGPGTRGEPKAHRGHVCTDCGTNGDCECAEGCCRGGCQRPSEHRGEPAGEAGRAGQETVRADEPGGWRGRLDVCGDSVLWGAARQSR